MSEFPDNVRALLADPNAVHLNMLRGTIAKPSVEQIAHIYGRLRLLIQEPETGWRKIESFSADERARLWPIAETLAMMDGNAFFVMKGKYQSEHVASYLPEASALYEANGGDAGWAGEAILATPGHRNGSPDSQPFVP